MGVSFKISKVGTRFCPKPAPDENPAAGAISDGRLDSDDLSGPPLSSSKRKRESHVIQSGDNVVGSCYDKDDSSFLGQEVSFTLDLFPDGFSIGKAAESDTLEPSLREVSKSLHPYNRSSEALFSAIEMGRLPGDILDDIPSNYFNGSILCEVRDYRERIPESEDVRVVAGGLPVRHKLCLRMSLENIVKDIPSISNDSWTYGDLMEVESRILKATQPRLCLDPTPMLDKLSETPVCNKLDLGICQARKKRLKLLGAVTVTPNNKTHGKKISIDRTCEGVNGKFSEMGHATGDRSLHAHDHLAAQQSLMSNNFVTDARASTSFAGQSRFQSSIGYPKSYQDRGSGLPSTTVTTNASNGVASSQDVINSYVNSSRNIQGIRNNLDIQMAQMASMKRSNQTALDGLSQQSSVSTLDSIHGVDSTGKTTMMQHQIDMRGIQYSNVGGQKYPLGDARQSIAEYSSIPESMASFYSDQRIFRQGVKEERMELEPMKSEADRSRDDSLNMVNELSQMNQFHRQPQQAFVRSHFPNQSPWNNLGSLVEKDHRKDEQLQKRRSVHSPRISGGAVIQPPISKSGDNSSGSMGHHGGPVSTAQGSQKDKMTAISGGAGNIASVVSSPNDSVQRQHQPPGSGKRKPSSVSKNPSMGGVASPASVSNVNVPLNASSPSVGTPPMADQVLMERFLKIDAITMRLQLNSKKNKVDECPIPPHRKLSQDVSIHLSNALNDEDVIEKSSPFVMSKSLIGGSLNTCKSRTIDFMLTEHLLQGNGVSIVVPKFRDKITLIERSRDGMVALVPGEIDENGSVPHLDLLPAFSNTYYADLFGAQLCSLMVKEGYQIMDDRIRAAPTLLSNTSLGSYNAVGTSSDIIPSESQYSENVSGQLAGASLANNGLVSMTAPQNVMSNPPLLPSGSVQSVQMSQGFFSAGGMPARPSPLEPNALPPQSSQHIQQNQQHQMQKSLLMQNSPLSQLGVIGPAGNINMSNPMVNKTSLQLRLFQQQQQQQQSQMPRKMMMGLTGAVGMGSLGNNNVGLSGLNSVMGIGGIRGIGPGISAPMGLPSGISAPMGISSLPGVSSLGQNPINISQNSSISNVLSQHMRSGSFTPAQAAAIKLMHSRGGNTLGGQAGIAGMSGNSPMHSNSPLSMLGQNLNRGNVNPMQRAAMATMGPPKIPGINVYMNQQQQVQLQQQQHFQQLHQQQLLQQQQQQQQHHQQQQQTGSPLQNQQTIVSSPQVGSPAMSIQQQLSQPQQIGSPALSQQNPMSPQLSAGALQQMNNVGNAAPPASPQLSSQTLGSVGSISSSPMELQVVNKGSSINNI